MSKTKKIITIFSVFILIIFVIILFFTDFIIPSKFIYLSDYNDGKKGFSLTENVETINLNKSDDKSSRLNKIKYCKNLKKVFINYTVNDFKFLNNMKLDKLYVLYDCKDWNSISCIEEINSLYIIPIGTENTFNDCSVLKKFTALKTLSVCDGVKIDFSELRDLPAFTELEINSPEIDISKISILDNITKLSISCGNNEENGYYNSPKNIMYLSESNIDTLIFWNTYIDDISFADHIPNLKNIEFSNCSFSETESEVESFISVLKSKGINVKVENNIFL